ncbi:MAG: hypothetical protein Q9226_001978 [Calogaya cf. arnoldii]
MARNNRLGATDVCIEPAESQGEKQSRSMKVKLFKWQAVTAAICIVARSSILYFCTICTIRELQQSKHPALIPANVVACVFLFTEMMFTLRRFFAQHLQAIAYGPKAAFHPHLRVTGNQVPQIDVLIFSCGEKLSVLLDTARAACSLDYPPDKFRVSVLDDSNSVADAIKALKTQFPNLFYSARKRTDRSWHKAGNINHGLQFVASLPGGPCELVAGLDVDMIPEKQWLRHLVPHFCRNPTMGLVCVNQRSYNVPPGDFLGQLLQMDQMQLVRNTRQDFTGEGIGTGTGWMASRVALDANNGFAIDGICEDYLTSVDIAASGWKVALLDEDLQWGLLPESLNGHSKQAQRWLSAVLSFHQALGTPKRSTNKGTIKFKFIADVSTIAYGMGMSLCYFGIPLLVLSGLPLVVVHLEDSGQIRKLLVLGFVDFVTQSALGFLESWTADFTIYSWHEPSHLWHTPWYIGPFLRRWFPRFAALTVGTVSKFSPSISTANESSEDRYTSRWKRLKVVCTECSVLPHLFVLGACIVGGLSFLNNIFYQYDGASKFEYIITHVGYPPALFLWSSALRNACTPFWYALFVPPRMEREKYLVRDEKSGAAYPTREAKDQRHRRVKEWHLVFTLVYFLGVLIWSYWL